MLVCQWHLDIIYGKQAEAVRPPSIHWRISRRPSEGWLHPNFGLIRTRSRR